MAWQPAVMVIPAATAKRISRLEVRVSVEDAEGVVNVTDLMLQGGVLPILWSGHAAEIRFSFEQ